MGGRGSKGSGSGAGSGGGGTAGKQSAAVPAGTGAAQAQAASAQPVRPQTAQGQQERIQRLQNDYNTKLAAYNDARNRYQRANPRSAEGAAALRDMKSLDGEQQLAYNRLFDAKRGK